MDTVLLLGALIASLGIAAFGFLYFVSKDEDSYDKDARAKEKLIPANTKNSSKGKKQKKEKKAKTPKKAAPAPVEPVAPEEPVVEEVAEPVKVAEPVAAAPVEIVKEKTPEPAPVAVVEAVKPTKKANKNDLVIPAGKMSDEDAEGAIAAILKKLGNRVPKGSKVTLASNVDNLKAKMDEIKKAAAKHESDLNASLARNFEIESQIEEAKQNATVAENAATDALARARKAEKDAADKAAEFDRKIKSGEEGMSKELENLKTNNATLQAALMSNAQKLAAMGDAETLRKDLEKQRSLRFDFAKEADELKVKLAAATDASNAATAELETAKASVAALSAQVVELTAAAATQAPDLSADLAAANDAAAELKTQLDAAQTELGVTNTALEAEKAQVAELQGSLDEAKAAGDASEALEAQLSELKSSVATKDEEIANAATATEEAKAAVESAQQELAAANDKITALEAQLEEAKNTEAPEPEVDNSALEAAQAELVSVKEDLTAAKDAAEANTAKVSDLEKQLEEKNAELEKSNQEVETINAQISEAAEKVKSIEAQCEEQMTKSKTLEDEKEALAAQNAELSAKIASNEDQLQVVNVDDDSAKDTRIGELESEIDTLKEQISQAKSKNEELRERNWKAMDAIANAESISKQKATALEEAEKKITELETTSETADDELNSTRAENVKFKGILAETETMLNTLQSEVDAEHNGLHERIRELEARLASKELEQKQNAEGSSV